MPTDDSDIDDILQRRRKKRAASQTRLLLVGGLAVAFVVAVGCAGGLVAVLVGGSSARVSVAGPSEKREGQTWTLAELFTFLKEKGVVGEIKNKGQRFHGELWVDMTTTDGRPAVQVVKYDSPTKARDRAGQTADGTVIAWGVFTFDAELETIRQIKSALR